jgi:hypothetical protein
MSSIFGILIHDFGDVREIFSPVGMAPFPIQDQRGRVAAAN